MTMPKLTPMQWGAIILVLAVVVYFGFFYKKKPAIAPAAPAGKPAEVKKESGYNEVDATMVSQGAGI